jgi:hypothetical protein
MSELEDSIDIWDAFVSGFNWSKDESEEISGIVS